MSLLRCINYRVKIKMFTIVKIDEASIPVRVDPKQRSAIQRTNIPQSFINN